MSDPTTQLIPDPPWPPQPDPRAPSMSDTQAISVLRKRFSKTAQTVIGSLLASFALYVWHMEGRISELKTLVRNLDHDMPRDGGVAAREAADLKAVVSGIAATQTAQERHLESNDKRLDKIEDHFDVNYIADEMKPFSKRNRK